MTLFAAATSAAPLAWLKTLALLLFFCFFLVILLRLIVSRPERFDAAARLPLDDEPGGMTPSDEAYR